MASNKRLKILCIHGYRQSGQTFREKTGSLRKLLKNHAEFVYITAPHKVPPGNLGSAAASESEASCDTPQEKNDENGWWFSREDDYFKSTDYSNISKGFQASVDMIISVLENPPDGGFDGILGFSQGACLVSMLCLLQQKEQKNWFKFAVLVAGFKSRSSNHDIFYLHQAAIPSLHVYGETDRIISTEMSQELLQYFENPTTLIHSGGHFVPASGQQKKMYFDFFDKMLTAS
ncbi:ovarian cancer-associated gene 2 protein [Biomphalaria glabrata]|nr:ovarian cancer-associated gene 2 protein [Biomphalaria glabrata]